MTIQSTDRAGGEDSEIRETDYAEDVAESQSHAVSADFAPDTGARLRKAMLIFAAVLGAAFVLVSIDRFFKARSVAR
ncbi:MAG TPA: hypothetical protein VKQ31_00855, partial [Steroidobacteraceae bacterium]|nr:hypothetical protein [Steroidobacteraceae bacterium]